MRRIYLKIFFYFLLGALCLAQICIWAAGMTPPYPEMPSWVRGMFFLTSPTFFIVYSVLTLWAIAIYLEELRDTDTDIMEGTFAVMGFILFFSISIIELAFSMPGRGITGLLIEVSLNMLTSQLLLCVACCLFGGAIKEY